MLPKRSTIQKWCNNQALPQTEVYWHAVEIHLAPAVFWLLLLKKVKENLHSCDTAKNTCFTVPPRRFLFSLAYGHNLIKLKHQDYFHDKLTICVWISRVQLFATPWTVGHQVPLSMDFPGRSIGVACHFLLQGIFLTQGSNHGLPHCRQTLYRLELPGQT